MEIHIPYQQLYKREPDFIVSYEIDPCEEIKHTKACQGMRVDFKYDSDGPESRLVYMIWPELLDKEGKVIKEITPGIMDSSGLANMWVLNPDMRAYHTNRITVGEKGYWVIGPYRLANVLVTQIGSLKNLKGEK